MNPIDHSSRREFVDYYAAASQTVETRERFLAVQRAVLRLGTRVWGEERAARILDVADIGCNAGTQCLLWAQLGHRVHGLDVNEPLLNIARQRAADAGADVDLRLGTAAALPWADASMDVCLVPELLEHVAEWRQCLEEFCRVLRPGGILYLSTTNWLCPVQQEFALPLYSWYPAPLKRHFERLASTTRPELVNHATYPAVNWFSYYALARLLSRRGFNCYGRFDLLDSSGRTLKVRVLAGLLRSSSVAQLVGQLLTPYTVVFAVK